MSRSKDDSNGCFIGFVVICFVGVLIFMLAVAKCAPLTPSEQDGCEWEKKRTRTASHGFLGAFGRSGGTSGGKGGGGFKAPAPAAPKPNLNKGSASGGTGSKPKVNVNKYSKTNPPPMPRTPAGSGYKWVLDCD